MPRAQAETGPRLLPPAVAGADNSCCPSRGVAVASLPEAGSPFSALPADRRLCAFWCPAIRWQPHTTAVVLSVLFLICRSGFSVAFHMIWNTGLGQLCPACSSKATLVGLVLPQATTYLDGLTHRSPSRRCFLVIRTE